MGEGSMQGRLRESERREESPEGQSVLPAALSRQGPAVHPRAEPRRRITRLEGIGGKSGGIAQQQGGGYSRGTLQAFKWSPWRWHSHLYAGHHCAFGNRITDSLREEQLGSVQQQTKS